MSDARQQAIDAIAEAIWHRYMSESWLGLGLSEKLAILALDAIPGDVHAQLAINKAPNEPHVVKFDEAGWTLKHPLRCRLGDLFDCPVNLACQDITGPPNEGFGIYETELVDSALVYRLAVKDPQ